MNHQDHCHIYCYVCVYLCMYVCVLFQTSDISVFETNIRFIGGLLSCFALTGDVIFKERAQQIADKLLPAFQTPTGIPNALVNLKTGVSSSSFTHIHTIASITHTHTYPMRTNYHNSQVNMIDH